MQDIVTLIIAILGSGGLSALVATIINARKSSAETKKMLYEAEAKHIQNQRECDEYIHNQLKEITETHRKEAEELRAMNKELNSRIIELDNKIDELMIWITQDNSAYRTWLETELRKYNPDIEFPKCPPPPGYITNRDDNESESDS